ncbi:pyruvate kinase [Paenibacillus sp. YYML68]|uniref:pyruvate kinase n=1 Tax=Paenibacillus sp. YYML68 TaxID=2909250 RepID=UPI00249105C2|nr:pyruvate kinase [Paenibacillus sp. YYML68]
MPRTKIVCTMGPACDQVPLLKDMIKAGMNVARLNMAHGDLDEQRARIEKVRQAERETGMPVAILLDIKGPEVRIGKLKDSSYMLETGEVLTLTTEQIEGDGKRIAVNYPELTNDVKPGSRILLDDGLIELKVESVEGTEIHTRIMNGGLIKPRKGVNLPGTHTSLPGVTARDVEHIRFGVEEGVDIVAASFVRKAADVLEIRSLLEELGAGHVQIISKIENQEGVDELDAILEASDGLMVARGDLGVEVPVEEVPLLQKMMIQKCNLAGKPVITATHMLDSMQMNPRPTRAESSDVANAVLDGSDAIMLSGETAAGKYPLESVQTMAAIAARTEASIDFVERFTSRAQLHKTNITEVISRSVVSASLELAAKAIVTPTMSGFTARMVSKYRPKAPIIAAAPDEQMVRRLCLVWGVTPVQAETVSTMDEMLASALVSGKKAGLVDSGDLVIVSAGVPVGKAGSTNLIKIVQAE